MAVFASIAMEGRIAQDTRVNQSVGVLDLGASWAHGDDGLHR